MARTVFVVDDNAADRRMICRLLQTKRPDYRVFGFGDMTECYGRILREEPDFLILDDHIEWMTANDTLKFIARLGYEGTTIVVSGIEVPARSERLSTLGAAAYLSKDDIYDDPELLLRQLDAAPPRRQLSGTERLKKHLRLYDEIAASR